jgi:hypothetical protein
MAIKDIYKNMGMPKITVKSVAKMEKKPVSGPLGGMRAPAMGGLMGAGVKPKSPVKPAMPAKSSGTRSVAPVRPIAPKPSMPGRAAASVAAPKAVAKMSKKK